MARSQAWHRQKIVQQYIDAGQPWPATVKQIAAWAIENKHWAPHGSKVLNMCANELSKAMREEYLTDPQGRKVRAKHVATLKERNEQFPLWADIRTASREHMSLAFSQRRQQIVGDCHQLKTDVDSFNENREPDRSIQMLLDFTEDVAEIEAVEADDAA